MVMFNSPLFVSAALCVTITVLACLWEFYKSPHWKWVVCALINSYIVFDLLFIPNESPWFALACMTGHLIVFALYLRADK